MLDLRSTLENAALDFLVSLRAYSLLRELKETVICSKDSDLGYNDLTLCSSFEVFGFLGAVSFVY